MRPDGIDEKQKRRSRGKRLAALILAMAAFASALAGCAAEKKKFQPDAAQVYSALSSIYVEPTRDAETVRKLYELYTQAVIGEALADGTGRSIVVVLTDSGSGDSLKWEVFPDGACSVSGEGARLMENGEEIYKQVKAVFDGLCDTERFAQRLYELKTPYIGDAAADGEILEALGIGKTLGGFTLELQTEQEPYGITLHLTPYDPDIPASDIDVVMGRFGYLFLALVDNAGSFAWDYDTPSGVHRCMVAAQAYDIKKFGESLESFTGLCEVVDSLSASEIHPEDIAISSGSDSYIMYGASADIVSSLWESLGALKYEESPVEPESSESTSVIFYDSKGEIVATWTFFGDCFAMNGDTEYYKVTEGNLNVGYLNSLYLSSKTSADYEAGIYRDSEIFG